WSQFTHYFSLFSFPVFILLPTLLPLIYTLFSLHDALPISYLDQCDLIVDDRIIQCEIHEISERISRVVELGDRLRVLIERIIVRSEEQRLNSSHVSISYAVFCLKKKT